MARRILVASPEHGSQQFVERPADSEFELQTVLLANPELIPSDDLGLDGDLLVVGRETTLASGSVDLLCLSQAGEIVIIEFKTGPQNPDFRHALAQVIDYGSDLWRLDNWQTFDQSIVRQYLKSSHTSPRFTAAHDLRDMTRIAWHLDDDAFALLTSRLDEVLSTGDFNFVVMAQRFTETMRTSVTYLNNVSQVGRYSLIELVRMDSPGPLPTRAYASTVVLTPQAAKPSSRTREKISEDEFLSAISDPSYRSAVSELFATSTALGLIQRRGTKGMTLRLQTPDRNEPLTVVWAFLSDDGWTTAKHITFGVDPTSLKACPSVAEAVSTYCVEVAGLAGGSPAGGSLSATVFVPEAFVAAKAELVVALTRLVEATQTQAN